MIFIGGHGDEGISVVSSYPGEYEVKQNEIKTAKAMAEGKKRLLGLIGYAKDVDEIEGLPSRISNEIRKRPEYSNIYIQRDLDDFLKHTTEDLYSMMHKTIEENTGYKKKSRHRSYKVRQKYENGPLTIEINEIKKQFASVGRYRVLDYTYMYFPVVNLPNKFAAKFVSLVGGSKPYETGYTLDSDIKIYDGNKLVFNVKLEEIASENHKAPVSISNYGQNRWEYHHWIHWPIEESYHNREFALKTYVPGEWEKKLANNNKNQG